MSKNSDIFRGMSDELKQDSGLMSIFAKFTSQLSILKEARPELYENYAVLHSMAVAKSYRGRGIATDQAEYAVRHAKEVLGCHYLHAVTVQP